MIKVGKPGQLLNPPGWPLLAAGLIAGLVSSLLTLLTLPSLPSSADTATAVGLAWLIGVALGGWLGLAAVKALGFWFPIIYKSQRAPAEAAFSSVKSRLAALQAILDEDGIIIPTINGYSPHRNTQLPISTRAGRSLWRLSWGFYPFGIFAIFTCGFSIGLLYVGGVDIYLYLILLTAGTVVTGSALLFAWIFPIALNRKILRDSRRALGKIDRIEQRLADARAERIAIPIYDLSIVEAAMTEPPKWLTRLAA